MLTAEIHTHTFKTENCESIVVLCADLPDGHACSVTRFSATGPYVVGMFTDNFDRSKYRAHDSRDAAVRAAKAWVRRKCRKAAA